ncbi:hypothetical protein L3Q65_45905 [Amycolatopsis sp. FU40]|uniref:hypothetical protein n=1 Tax=Amycolatopsis sp. FU40 TaxID=2914159 RepID=UPI001F35A9DA|nr:hypothetical protein [Amycolatopsis sp. FU40]UKD55110.1 hypothetical protein L3Q65_45905 [Amycolatopsis sp. FU40]
MTTSDLIDKNDPIIQERARRLLRNAAKAVDEFEDAVRELVAMRAWIALGYKDFREMWQAENGFECPDRAVVLASAVVIGEGMDQRTGGEARWGKPKTGHTTADVARMVGLRIEGRGHSNPAKTKGSRTPSSPQVTQIRKQLDAGVPADKVSIGASNGTVKKVIERFGSRARSKPQRIGKSPDENVREGFEITRRYADAANEHAREMGVPKAEVYRRAVIEYLDRHGINAFYGQAPNGAVSEVP